LNDFHGSGSTGPVFDSVTKKPLFHLLMNGPAESLSGRIFLFAARQQSVHMKIVASLTDPDDASRAQEQGADIVELRFDLMTGDPVTLVRTCRDVCSLPVIGTIRSAQEGGQFFGDAGSWFEKIQPVITLVDSIDIEQQFSSFSQRIKETGTAIIASYHSGQTMPLHDLFRLERDLRMYGDIVKIIVTPRHEDDIIDLIAFTHAIKKPLCTGVMGAQFRYARAILPLFGSELAYCHTGSRTAEGQYSVQEFRTLDKLLAGGQQDSSPGKGA
jgi:3-dehydroquinate dehydratase-1